MPRPQPSCWRRWGVVAVSTFMIYRHLRAELLQLFFAIQLMRTSIIFLTASLHSTIERESFSFETGLRCPGSSAAHHTTHAEAAYLLVCSMVVNLQKADVRAGQNRTPWPPSPPSKCALLLAKCQFVPRAVATLDPAALRTLLVALGHLEHPRNSRLHTRHDGRAVRRTQPCTNAIHSQPTL